MRTKLAFLSILVSAGCARQGHSGEIAAHIPVKVAGVIYAWPTDGTWSPSEIKGFALIPERMWNASIGVSPGTSVHTGEKDLTIWLSPADTSNWNIKPDGSGLPLMGGEHFVRTQSTKGYSIGQGQGAGILKPSTIVVFAGEKNAYAECIQITTGSNGCILLMNDRGVEHTLPLRWGAWDSVPVELRLYRQLIGAPTPKST